MRARARLSRALTVASAAVATAESLQLRQLQVIHRHGDRTPITPLADRAFWSSVLPSEAELAKMAADLPRLTRAVFDKIGLLNPILAFDRFWRNERVPSSGIGLQEHYIRAAAALGRALGPQLLLCGVGMHKTCDQS